MSSEVTDLLNALRNGVMTLDQVAERFRQRSWPRRATPLPTTYIEHARAAQQDPEPYRAGSWDDVVAARDEGRITDEEYVVLSEAVAQSKRAEDQGEGEAAGSSDSA